MDQILDTYYADNARKLHIVVDKLLLKFGGLSCKDTDDFYSLANEVFVDVLNRYDNSKSFDAFLYVCLSNKIKSEMTKRNREKRKADRMSISIDTPIGDEDDSTLKDIIADSVDVEKEIFEDRDFSRRFFTMCSDCLCGCAAFSIAAGSPDSAACFGCGEYGV